MRIVLQYLLPLILPAAAYAGWILIAKRQKISMQDGPWFWLIVAGFALMAGGLVFLALSGGSEPGGTYYPSYIKDGKVIPGEFK
jgi:4-amino-4-deoxy-L-arabinose transferase-like glycosyltransferase